MNAIIDLFSRDFCDYAYVLEVDFCNVMIDNEETNLDSNQPF